MHIDVLCLFMVLSVTISEQAAAEQPELESLVQGVVARAEAVLSGRFEYEVEYEVKVGKPNAADEVILEQHELVFIGLDWRDDLLLSDGLRWKQRINHGDTFLDISRVPQLDGSIETSVVMERNKSRERQKPHPPYFAGTVWYNNTIEYLRAHANQGQVKGEAEVNGVACTVIEWQVPQTDRFNAFEMIGPLLAKGGLLRLYVAPQLGYALPRIEHVASDGTVEKRFDATDFDELSAGIFIPKHIGNQFLSKAGEPKFSIQYNISKIEKINEPIPDDDFVVELPSGAVVVDNRGPQSFTFRANTQIGALPSDISQVLRIPEKSSAMSWWRAAGIGVTIGVLLILLMILWHRKKARLMT